MELAQQLVAAFQGIPPAAIIIFLIVSVVIAIELWRLRPQRERPPIPTPPDVTPPPVPAPDQNQASSPAAPPGGFKPLSNQQLAILIGLLLTVVAVPAAVLIYQQTRPKPTAPLPIVSPSPRPRQTPKSRRIITPTPSPRLTPTPIASPTAKPAGKPTASPRSTKKPGRTSTPSPAKTASPAGLPRVKKPGELPGAGTPLLLLPFLAGSGLVAYGIKKLRKS